MTMAKLPDGEIAGVLVSHRKANARGPGSVGAERSCKSPIALDSTTIGTEGVHMPGIQLVPYPINETGKGAAV